ncbi:unnamed protein product [Medioppia subpectinata]|uniref:non-specific serine/threonine protein kinase n=1 Tax=Medioppia subpectinata TaxID=1979941 RepID=A0A7R9PTZ3_9ACAR|nr:unnamed protein product [Medioppia subpectinata]CAG2100645.1 unnamed protein product [Medioppia subpectinata]
MGCTNMSSFFRNNFEKLLQIKKDKDNDHKRQIELLECVQYLHQSCPPVIHRDLKPSNVLISQNNNTYNKRFLKLCDFGSATSDDMTSMTNTFSIGTSQYTALER